MYSANVDILENVDPGSQEPQVSDVSVGNLLVHQDNENSKTNSSEEPRTQNISLFRKMVILVRELCFLLLLVLTYATFQNNTPKISKSPNAFPFFPPGSIVKDWYRGQLSEAIGQASESDLAFVMYYAPWDAESQSVRHEFDIVSQHLHQYVHFAAINCWHPGSECNTQYNKVYSWPVLMAYPTHGRGIQYKGPRKAEHMIKFLQSVLQPFTRITNIGDLAEYTTQYDAVIVGHVNANVGSYDYGVLYSTALRFLERDPLQEVKFLIATGNSITGFYGNFPDLHLMVWNETKVMMPENGDWRPDALLTWIFDKLHQVSTWVAPTGSKSQYLTQYLQPGPAVILFTPRNPLYDVTDYYTVLRDVAMEYYNCNNNSMASMIIQMQQTLAITLRHLKRDNYWKHKQLLKNCSIQEHIKAKKNIPVVTYDISKLMLNNTCSAKDYEDLSVCVNLSDVNKNKCDKFVNLYVHNKKYLQTHEESTSSKKESNETFEDVPWTSMFTGEGDHRSPANLQKFAEFEKCRFMKLAHRLQPGLFAPRTNSENDPSDDVTGLACKTNLTLSFVALDSLQYYYFAESLGIDILKKQDKTAVVIIYPKFETHHIMMEPYNTSNLRSFIRNFTNNNLKRVLTTTMTSQIQRRKKETISTMSQENMKELTTTTFLPVVMQSNQVVIILYHSIKCAFCSGISHVLLSVARLLSPITRLQFARIDGDEHALPWEYSMHHYPTILFFPAQRKSESRAFPHNVAITVPNVLSFILANVESEMRLHIIWTLCRQTKYEQDLQTCGRTLRLESTSLVGKMLREYRSSSSAQQSAAVFKRLQHIRLLQFLFTSSVRLHAATIQHHMSMIYSNSQNESNFVHEIL